MKIRVGNWIYNRKIEEMGEKLVLFKVVVVPRHIGQNYHICFEDNRKPPLDIAIQPNDNTIEYVSYFVMDEKIEEMNDSLARGEVEEIDISQVNFPVNLPYCTQKRLFHFWRNKGDIIVLKEGYQTAKVSLFRLNETNGLLFNGNEFIGCLFEKINEDEWLILKKAKCL